MKALLSLVFVSSVSFLASSSQAAPVESNSEYKPYLASVKNRGISCLYYIKAMEGTLNVLPASNGIYFEATEEAVEKISELECVASVKKYRK